VSALSGRHPDPVRDMGWTLAPGVGFCIAGDEIIVLDLRTDRYLALRGELCAAFHRLRETAPNDSEAMTAIVGTGLVTRCNGATVLEPPRVIVPDADLEGCPRSRSDMRMALSAVWHLNWARRAQSSHRLATTAANLSHRKCILQGSADEEGMTRIAACFASVRALVPIRPRCLVDSLALFRLMLRRGLAPTLVFGVRLEPFAAHCWLQTSEMVLTGSVDDAHNFTPILVV